MTARKPAIACGVGFATLIATLACAWSAGFRLNVTESVPLGIYRVTDAPAGRGDLVEFCPDADSPVIRLGIERSYLPSGPCPGNVSRLLKPIVGLPGDRIEATPEGVRVNGALMPGSAAQPRDARGLTLPTPATAYTVPAGHVVVLTRNPASFDSRYFGPVPAESLSGVVRAIVLF